MNLGRAVRGPHDDFVCIDPATIFGSVWIWAMQYVGCIVTLFVLALRLYSGRYEFGLYNTWAALWFYLYWPCNCLRIGMNLGCVIRGSHDDFIRIDPATVFGSGWMNLTVQYVGRMMTLFVLTPQLSSGRYEFGLCSTWAAWWLYLYWPCDCLRVGINLECAVRGPHDDFICIDLATVFGSVWILAVQYAGRMMILFVLTLQLCWGGYEFGLCKPACANSDQVHLRFYVRSK